MSDKYPTFPTVNAAAEHCGGLNEARVKDDKGKLPPRWWVYKYTSKAEGLSTWVVAPTEEAAMRQVLEEAGIELVSVGRLKPEAPAAEPKPVKKLTADMLAEAVV